MKKKVRSIRSLIVTYALFLISLFLIGLMMMLTFLAPGLFIKTQQKFSDDVLTHISTNLSEVLTTVHNQYTALSNNDNFIKSLETINSFNQSMISGSYQWADINYAYDEINQYLLTVGFAHGGILDNVTIHMENYSTIENESGLYNYFQQRGKNEIMFLSRKEIAEYISVTSISVDYIIRFPLYNKNSVNIGSVCFFLDPGINNIILNENSLVILGSNGIVFSSFDNIIPTSILSKITNSKANISELNGNKYYINSDKLEIFNWTIINIIPFKRFANILKMLKTQSIVVFIIAFLISLYPLLILSKFISRNMLKVIHEMDMFLHEPSPHIEPKSQSRLSRFMNKLPLKQKILIYNIMVVLIPAIIISSIVFVQCTFTATLEYKTSAKTINSYAKYSIEKNIGYYSLLYKTILSDNEIKTLLYDYSNTRESDYHLKLYNQLGNRLTSLVSIQSMFEFNYYDNNGNFILSWPYMRKDRNINISYMTEGDSIALQNSQTGKYTLNILRRIYLETDDFRGRIGYCSIGISEPWLAGALNKYKSAHNFCFADSYKIIYLSENPSAYGENIDAYISQTNSDTIFFYDELSQHSLSSFISFSAEELYIFKVKLFFYLLSLIAFMYTMIIIFTNRLCNYLLCPVTNVNQVLENDNYPVYEQNRGDELDQLVVSVNHMKTRINTLIDEVYKHKILEKELELKALQSQITPHFLYNILEIINALVDIGDPRASELILLLSRFFRQGISRGQSIITLKEEIEYTKVYLEMQKILLESNLQINWDIESGLDNCEIINFSLQPILENIFKHGMYLEDYIRHISIKCYSASGFIRIAIRDNGIGIDKKTLCDLREKLNSSETGKSEIGLKNIHERLKLYFGENYGLKICSVYGKGTLVTIKIPKKPTTPKI